MTLADFSSLLAAKGCRPTGQGSQISALCPGHDDQRASLSVSAGDDGCILLNCFAGCSAESIVTKLGLTMADLFPRQPEKKRNSKGRIVATYDYTDENGKLIFQCVRYDPKDFRQRRPDASTLGGWTWNLKGVRRVLYRLHEVKKAIPEGQIIYIAEGEKDVDALVNYGLTATCNPLGAKLNGKTWLPQHTETLAGAEQVVIIADKDPAGRGHARVVATSLRGVAKSVKLIEIPDTNAKPVKDAADYFAAGGTAANLNIIVESAAEFTPAPDGQAELQQGMTNDESTTATRDAKPVENGPLPIKNATTPSGRPRLVLPGPNRPDSEFTSECGRKIGPMNVWFRKGDLVVGVRHKTFTDKIRHLAFHVFRPVEVTTAIEDFIEVGTLVKDKNGEETFVPVSMSDRRANILINSPQFKRELPEITRVLDYQIPIIHENHLIFPVRGFDPRFRIYTNPDAPEIIEMDQRTACMWLHELLKDFCFDGEQSLSHAIARLLTPMCRAAMGWDARGPFWIFTANRERLGKDYLAVVAGLLFDGFPNEDAPLEPNNSAETKKRITSAILAGRNRMHFANCSGFICDAALEQAITSKCWSDRILGGNTDISLPNEIEFSMSGNAGVVSYRGDLAHRARHIRLYFAEENPNGRKFTQPQLHRWVQQNRANILSALAALVRCWFLAGRPEGKTPFASFPEWAAIVGGVMQVNRLGDPCLPESMTQTGGDEEAKDMKVLFRLSHDRWGVTRVELKRITQLIEDGEGQLFSWLHLSEREGQTKLGKMLRRYEGRVLDGIILKVHADTTRPKFSFEPWQGGTKSSTNPTDLLLNVAEASQSADIADIADVLHPKSVLSNSDKQESGVEVAEPMGNERVNVRNVSEVRSAPVTIPRLIGDKSDLAEIAASILFSDVPVTLDIETYWKNALDRFQGDIRLLTVALPGQAPWIIDLKTIGYDLGPLKSALEAVLLVGHNIKFDLLWLDHKCGLKAERVFCTMTASRLLSAGRKKHEHNLTVVVDRYLDLSLPKDCSRSDWGAPALTPEQYQYAASDVIHLHHLMTVLEKELADSGLTEVARLEMLLIPVVVGVEAAGFAVDTEKLRQLRQESASRLATARATLLSALNAPDLNPNSPPQLKAAFLKLGVEIYDTKAETLAALDHPAAKALNQYREAKKQAEQIKTLLDSVKRDGRIHGSFNPTGADTGRFSSSKPNMQSISRGEVRACFIASQGSKLIIPDYSQIELRAVAALTGETRMLEAYRNKEDLHRITAAIILRKAAEDVTPGDRQSAKAVNFGLIYGQGPQGLVDYAQTTFGVKISLEEAATFHQRFFAEYRALSRWHQDARKRANGDASETRTRLGRRRFLPGKTEYWPRFTQFLNTPVQGGCADGLKRAMVAIALALPAGSRIISTVHDEIIVESPEGDAETVKEMVGTIMIAEMSRIFPEVRIEAEAKICANWGEK